MSHHRITRKIIFEQYENLDSEQKDQLIELKQLYFMENLEKIAVNIPLFKFLQKRTSDLCILWTSADKVRARTILEYFQIEESFKEILFSTKKEIDQDLAKIVNTLKCDSKDLIFYEDDLSVINELERLGLNVVPVAQ